MLSLVDSLAGHPKSLRQCLWAWAVSRREVLHSKTSMTTRTRFSLYWVVHAWSRVILTGKCDCCSHSTTSFSYLVTQTSSAYQMFEFLLFFWRSEEGLNTFSKNDRVNLPGKKGKRKLSGLSIFWNTRKKTWTFSKSNLILVVILVLTSAFPTELEKGKQLHWGLCTLLFS